MIPTGLNGIRKISTFSLNSLLQCCKKKEEDGIVLGLWNCSQGSGWLKIMKRLLQVTNLGKNGYYSKVSSISTGIWHIRIVIGFLIHLSSFCM